ncbi:1588_t:CDS:2, partial [Racocetra persica]
KQRKTEAVLVDNEKVFIAWLILQKNSKNKNYQNRAGNDVTQLCWQIKKEIKQIEEDMAIAFKEELLQEIKKIEKEESRTSLRQIQHEIFLS